MSHKKENWAFCNPYIYAVALLILILHVKNPPCAQCNHMATSSRYLKLHKAGVHEGVRYLCHKCDYVATQPGHLRQARHYLVHIYFWNFERDCTSYILLNISVTNIFFPHATVAPFSSIVIPWLDLYLLIFLRSYSFYLVLLGAKLPNTDYFVCPFVYTYIYLSLICCYFASIIALQFIDMFVCCIVA